MNDELSSEIIKKILSDSESSLSEHLGIEFLTLNKNEVSARMPVDHRTKQRFGILHGGASVALAETVASVAAWLNIDYQKNAVVGLEINANHLRSVTQGFVTATANPIKIGKMIQVWNIIIRNEQDQDICISRCTMAVIDRIKSND